MAGEYYPEANNVSFVAGSAGSAGSQIGPSTGGYTPPATINPVQPEGVCPNCGYCPHCGRGWSPYRVYPYNPYPYWYPNWTINSSIGGNSDIKVTS